VRTSETVHPLTVASSEPVTPAERIVDILAAERRTGTSFAVAWPAAVGQVLADAVGVELEAWRAALTETRPAWAAAWERRPATRAQRALAAVADDPERQALAAGEHAPAGYCARCDAPILAVPGQCGVRAMYCGGPCRRAASVARLAA